MCKGIKNAIEFVILCTQENFESEIEDTFISLRETIKKVKHNNDLLRFSSGKKKKASARISI